MLSRKFRILSTALIYLLLSACASKQIAVSESIQQRSAQEATKSTLTPEQAIETAEQKLLDAKAAELEFYAPLHLLQAQESITQAREYLVEPPKDIKNAALMAAIAAQNFIEDSYKNKTTVKANLKESLAHKEVLITLNTPTLLAEDYQDIMEDLLDLVKLIEKGDSAQAGRDQTSLLSDMSELEINTLKNIHLTEAEAFFEKADDIDADTYAEISFEKAAKVLEASNNFIRKNYRDRKGVKKAGEEALWATKHAYFVALESEKVIKLEAVESEKHILHIVSLLNSINQKAYGKDLEPQKLYNATEELIKMVSDLKKQLEASQLETKHTLNKLKTSPETSIISIENSVAPKSLAPVSTETQMPIKNAAAEQPLPLIFPDKSAGDDTAALELKNDEQGFDNVELMTE